MTKPGFLKITVHGLKHVPKLDLGYSSAHVKLTFQNQSVNTKASKLKGKNLNFNEDLTIPVGSFDCKDVLRMELFSSIDNMLVASCEVPLCNITKENILNQIYEMNFASQSNCEGESPIEAKLSILWSENEQKIAPTNTAESLTNDVVAPRPWFLRTKYYYDSGKGIYEYTTSFRLISQFARYGENTTNYILRKIGIESINSTHKIDQQIVPLLEKVDDVIDERISNAINLLVKGQDYVLKTKDATLEKVSKATSATLETVSKVKDATVENVSKVTNATVATVYKVKDATMDTVSKATHNTVETISNIVSFTTQQVVKTKDNTLSTVSSLSSSVFDVATKTAKSMTSFFQ